MLFLVSSVTFFFGPELNAEVGEDLLGSAVADSEEASSLAISKGFTSLIL